MTIAAVSGRADDPTAALLDHVATATAILRDERLALMRGAYEQMASITERKAAVLAALEAVITVVPRTQAAVGALTRLVAESRRNEMVLEAARDGLAVARRRIAAIARARRGVVAYLEDGSLISCRPERGDTDKSA